MYKPILFLFVILLSCCSRAPKDGLPFKKDSMEKQNEFSPVGFICLPPAEETIAPTQNDIDSFIIQRGKNYQLLHKKIDHACHWQEALLYSLIAANKFQINQANYDIACFLSGIYSKTDVSKHSKEIVLHFHDKVEKSSFDISQIEHFKEMKDTGEDLYFKKRSDGYIVPYIEKIKAEVVKGNRHSYGVLKKILVENDEEDYLLFYAYLMSDRYGYAPARKDVVSVIEKAFKKYNLGAIDPETQYFIDTVTQTKE